MKHSVILLSVLGAMASAACATDESPALERLDAEVAVAACPAEPVLTPRSSSALTPAITAFNAGARSGYTWCRVASVSQYSLQVCPATNASLQAVVDQLVNYEGDLRGWSFADGQVLTAAQIAAIEPFTTVCSPGGPALAASVRANVSRRQPMGWLIESEVPCHNCHEFGAFYVLYYPADGRVLLIPYVTGYDS
jgi:hypothetical protein